jgi:tetratricopeptide (TPR) repeat protein
MVLANNLASLLANNRRDAASLERAYTLARRLRGIEVPAFQDTYGWAEYRRGNLDAALAPLEAAAKGLPADPLAQFHLGMVYADLGRKDAAIAQFEKMLALDPLARLPEAVEAEGQLSRLRSAALAPQP